MHTVHREAFQAALNKTAPSVNRSNQAYGQASELLVALDLQVRKRQAAGETSTDFEISA